MSRIRFNEVSFSWEFGSEHEVRVLEDMNLEIEEGEFVSIVAPSGAGKSTMLLLISGLVEPQKGRLLLDGKPIEGPSKKIAVVAQTPKLFPWVTVRGNVEWGLRMRGIDRSTRQRIAERMLHNVGLQEWGTRRIDELSGGMKQRVAIARALAIESPVLLLDEALVGLDVQTRMLMQRFIVNLSQKMRKTIILVTHDIDEALLADRVLVLSRRPAKILKDLSVQLSRPRDIRDSRFGELSNLLSGVMEREVVHQAQLEGSWDEAVNADPVWTPVEENGVEKEGVVTQDRPTLVSTAN